MSIISYPPGLWDDRWHGERGTWRYQKLPDGRSALFACPLCGYGASLSDHTIAPDGTVSPSVVCPKEGCTFHESIRLEAWRP